MDSSEAAFAESIDSACRDLQAPLRTCVSSSETACQVNADVVNADVLGITDVLGMTLIVVFHADRVFSLFATRA